MSFFCLAVLMLLATMGPPSCLALENYCDPKFCPNSGGALHTSCLYNSSEVASDCEGFIGMGLSTLERNNILDRHNQWRQKVARGEELRGSPGPQPPAKSMPDLEWDDELELVAQAWANQCNFSHDRCRNVQRFYVGQNIAISQAIDLDEIDVADLVDLWYNEVDDIEKDDIEKFSRLSNDNGDFVAHYTQLVWAKTTHIGCGLTRFSTNQYGMLWPTALLVCNYGPGGNIFGEPVYQVD